MCKLQAFATGSVSVPPENMKLWMLFIILITSDVVLPSSVGTRNRTPTEQERLYKNLLTNYSKQLRPVKDVKTPIKLFFTFELIKIYEVNAKKQRMSVASRVKQEWQDDHLRWNASEYSGFASINISPSKIWVPDVGIYNEVENKDHKKTDISTNIMVTSNGTCYWTVPTFVHAMCSIDVSFFPLDLQQCSLRFGSLTYNAEEIRIVQGRLVYPFLIKNGEWHIYNTSTSTNTVWDSINHNSFSVVEVTFDMERDSVYYFVKMLVPCCLITCLTILGFILPPESGERMSLGMLILLAMTFFQQLTMKLVPMQDFPILSQYYFITSIEIGIALLVTTLTLNFYYCTNRKMPGLLKLVILKFLGNITRIRRPPNDDKGKHLESFISNVTQTEMQFDIELNESISSSKREVTDAGLSESSVGLVDYKIRDDSSITSSESSSCRNTELQNEAQEEDPTEWNKDWVLASRIVDRFSMYASFIIGLVTVLAVFIRAPMFWRAKTDMDE